LQGDAYPEEAIPLVLFNEEKKGKLISHFNSLSVSYLYSF
jgi:hypothetical protein